PVQALLHRRRRTVEHPDAHARIGRRQHRAEQRADAEHAEGHASRFIDAAGHRRDIHPQESLRDLFAHQRRSLRLQFRLRPVRRHLLQQPARPEGQGQPGHQYAQGQQQRPAAAGAHVLRDYVFRDIAHPLQCPKNA
ncbi:conserved hypothetical protein, partial [Ricinus communis]